MRIRRNASKLLASSSPRSASSSAGNDAPCEDSAVAADADAALFAASSSFELDGQAPVAVVSACARPCPRVVQSLQVCELNRSPWDVMPLCQLDAYRSHLSPQEGDEEENRAFATTGTGIEGNGFGGPRAVTKSTLIRPEKELSGSGGLEGEHRHEKQNLQVKKKTKKNSKKRVRKETTLWDQIIKEEARIIEEEQNNGSTLSGAICKKSDGKGWHCKRVANQPYSLCDYHLSQIRGYYHSSHHLQPHRPASTATPKPAAPAAKKASKKKKKKKKRMTNSDKDAPEFYYYYSGFGPWRGKRRGGGGGETKPDGAVSEANGATTDAAAAAAAAACKGCDDSLVVHGTEDGDREDDLDPESIDDVEDSSDDVGPIRKRRGRKPIKARSLKSLL